MHSTICLTSSQGNYYLYDFLKKEFMPCHPLIHLCYWLDEKNMLETLSTRIDGNGHIITERYSQDAIEYYRNKYLSLKARGYFSDITKEPFVEYNAQSVLESLSNIKHVVFEVTDACNLRCNYCINGCLYNMHAQTKNLRMSFETVKATLNYLCPLWSSELNRSANQEITVGFYGGEPLMNFSVIKKTVEYCNSLEQGKISFKYNMTTNATLLDKHIDFLVKNNFRITISLDGTEQGQSYRIFPNGKNSFKKVYSVLKEVQKKYPEFWKENVSFNSVLHNRNSVAETHQFIYEEFGKIPEIHAMNDSGILPERKDEFNNMFVSYYSSINLNNSKISQERFTSDPYIFNLCQFLLWYGNNQFYNYESFLYYDNSIIRAHTGTCFPFNRKIYISVNNQILPCERIGHQYALGKIENGRVILDAEKIAETYNRYYNKLYEQCQSCYMINGCQQCVFHMDDLNSEQPICKIWHSEQGIANHLKLFIDLLESRELSFANVFKEAALS